MWFCHTRPEDVDLFLLTLRSAAGPHRALADGHSVGAAGGHRGAKNRDAWRDRRIRLVYRAPEPGRQREDLDQSVRHFGVDIIAKRAVEYVPPNETSDTRLPAITTGKRTVRSPRLGADSAWTRIRDWARLGSAR